MKPLINIPSFGTINKDSSRLMITFLVLYSPFLCIFLCLAPYTVMLNSAWRKPHKKFWRAFVLLTVLSTAIIFILPTELYHFPKDPSGFFPEWCAYFINKILMAGFIFLPLSLAVTTHTIRTRKKAK